MESTGNELSIGDTHYSVRMGVFLAEQVNRFSVAAYRLIEHANRATNQAAKSVNPERFISSYRNIIEASKIDSILELDFYNKFWWLSDLFLTHGAPILAVILEVSARRTHSTNKHHKILIESLLGVSGLFDVCFYYYIKFKKKSLVISPEDVQGEVLNTDKELSNRLSGAIKIALILLLNYDPRDYDEADHVGIFSLSLLNAFVISRNIFKIVISFSEQTESNLNNITQPNTTQDNVIELVVDSCESIQDETSELKVCNRFSMMQLMAILFFEWAAAGFYGHGVLHGIVDLNGQRDDDSSYLTSKYLAGYTILFGAIMKILEVLVISWSYRDDMAKLFDSAIACCCNLDITESIVSKKTVLFDTGSEGSINSKNLPVII